MNRTATTPTANCQGSKQTGRHYNVLMQLQLFYIWYMFTLPFIFLGSKAQMTNYTLYHQTLKLPAVRPLQVTMPKIPFTNMKCIKGLESHVKICRSEWGQDCKQTAEKAPASPQGGTAVLPRGQHFTGRLAMSHWYTVCLSAPTLIYSQRFIKGRSKQIACLRFVSDFQVEKARWSRQMYWCLSPLCLHKTCTLVLQQVSLKSAPIQRGWNSRNNSISNILRVFLYCTWILLGHYSIWIHCFRSVLLF